MILRRKIFLSEGAENFCRGTLVCYVSESFRKRKSLWIRGGEESVKLFRRKIFVSQCRNFSYGNPSVLRFRKVPLAKKLTDKRRGGGEVSTFSSKIFCLTVPKFSFGKPFSVSLISGIEKVWIGGGRGGGCRSIKILRRKNFV